MSPAPGWRLDPVEVRTAEPDPVPPRPLPVRAAVALMVLGGAMTALEAVVGLVAWDRAGIERRLATQAVNPGDLDGFVTIVIVVGFLVGVATAGMWIATAVGTARGRRGARSWATVLAGLFAVITVAGLVGSSLGLDDAVRLVTLVVGVAAAGLLWLPPSRAFFGAAARRR